jgi:ABC-type amino acid transport substrate-binding protein
VVLDQGKLKELSQYTVGIQRGYVYSEEFKNMKSEHKIVFNSVEQMMSLIKANRVDLAIISMAEYIAQKDSLKFKNIDIILPAFTSSASYLAFSKSKKIHITELFSKAMKNYKASNYYQI